MDKKQIPIKIQGFPAINLLYAHINKGMVDKINNYIDINRDSLKDHSSELVGQIRQDKKSAQLELNLKHKVPAELAEILGYLTKKYSQHHNMEIHKINFHKMWSIHSYAGDYNPLHEHGKQSMLGMSCILFLKVPSGLKATHKDSDIASLNNASGNSDGLTQFIWGANCYMDRVNFRGPTEGFVIPEVGKLVMFPIWLKHQVCPFFVEGERRTLSANIGIIPKQLPNYT